MRSVFKFLFLFSGLITVLFLIGVVLPFLVSAKSTVAAIVGFVLVLLGVFGFLFTLFEVFSKKDMEVDNVK